MNPIENMTREELIEAYVKREKELCEKIESKYKNEQALVSEKKLLSEENNKLNKKVDALKCEVIERRQELVEKNEYIKLLENARYSSQRNSIPEFNNGSTLFSLIDDEEMTTELKELKEDEAEMKSEEITYIRKKPNRKECHLNYDHLKQEVINVPAPEGFDICDICGSSMELKKYNERKELVYTPASLVVRIYRTPVYECKKCQSDNADGKSTYKSVSGVKP